LCGSSNWGKNHENGKDNLVTVELTFAHSDSNLKIDMFTTLNENLRNESWGIRDFHLILEDESYKGQNQ
jgi:hypothetical protein